MRIRRFVFVVLLLVGAIPLVTFGTCGPTPVGYGYSLFSTNDNLLHDVLDVFRCGDDDECDD